MIDTDSNFPLRQKILLLLAIIAGLLIWICAAMNIFSQDRINSAIFVYGFAMPCSLLMFPTLIDLNDKRVFFIWLIISIVLLIFSIATFNSDKFLIIPSARFERPSGIDALMDRHSTWALKALFIFLVVYSLLNQLSKKLTGKFLINTARQLTWMNEEAGRRITGVDVICNLILYATVILSALF